MMPPRDYSALTSPVTTSDVTESKRHVAERGGPAPAKGLWGTTIILTIVIAWILLQFTFTASTGVTTGTRSPGSWVVVGIMIVAVIVGAGALGRVIERRAWARFIRLTRFAAANGLVYSPDGGGRSYPGLLFSIGRSRQFTGLLSRTEAPAFDMGNYRTHNRGYVAMRLERQLPHMVLDAVGNNGLFGASNLPRAFGRDQVLSLEGDFNTYFTFVLPPRV